MKLEVGSGFNPTEGYTHLEIDSKCPHVEIIASADNIPLKDNAVDDLLAQHIIEHFPWQQTEKVLAEWYRVLKPGGVIKIICPDLDYILRVYLGLNNSFLDDWKAEVTEPGMTFPDGADKDIDIWANFKLFSSDAKYDNHFATFNYRLLKKRLENAGFDRIDRKRRRKSLNVWARKPQKGLKLKCSLCNKIHETVHRELFEGMCIDCSSKSIHNERMISDARNRNRRLK